jgi:hypothetical protein
MQTATSPHTNTPPSPASTAYETLRRDGAYHLGDQKCYFGGFVLESTACRGAHACPLPEGHRAHIGCSGVRHVEQGKGTRVDGIGFMVRTDFTAQHEPVVFVYPYNLSGNTSAFYAPSIPTEVQRLAESVRANGVEVNGVRVAPRRIVAETIVLDFHGRGPAEWQAQRERTSLTGMSFSGPRRP